MDQKLLDAILQYKNEDVLARFTDLYAVTDDEAQDIFTETKKFLFISQLPGVFVNDDLLIIDEMWHNFILFTKEYHSFCHQYFSRFYHHLPSSKTDKEHFKMILKNDPNRARQEYKDRLASLMSVTYDALGSDTVVKWFDIYPEKYSKSKIKALRK